MIGDKFKQTMKEVGDAAKGPLDGMVGALTDINRVIEQINDVLVTMRALGLTIEMMKMQVVPPQATICVTGALEEINQGKAKELIKGKENPILMLILQAICSLALLRKPLSEAGFKGVRMAIQAGIVPNIDLEFLP